MDFGKSDPRELPAHFFAGAIGLLDDSALRANTDQIQKLQKIEDEPT